MRARRPTVSLESGPARGALSRKPCTAMGVYLWTAWSSDSSGNDPDIFVPRVDKNKVELYLIDPKIISSPPRPSPVPSAPYIEVEKWARNFVPLRTQGRELLGGRSHRQQRADLSGGFLHPQKRC